MIHSGKSDWYVFDKATGSPIRGPYSTKDQARCECFDLPRGSFRIAREAAVAGVFNA
jgi:hypothetical protein